MTTEYVELIGEKYYQTFIKCMTSGFISLRENKEELLWILKIMHIDYSSFEARFFPDIPDHKIEDKIIEILANCTNALGSKLKDYFHSLGNKWKTMKEKK